MKRLAIAVPTSRGYWARRASRTLLRLKAGPAFPALTGLITASIAGVLVWSGSATPGALVAIAVQGSATAAALYWQASVLRSSISLVEVASAFISESQDDSIDRMLGVLMGLPKDSGDLGDPASPLFDVLSGKLPGAPFEFKRRVAEALPVLALLNSGRAFELATELRMDVDPRWKADVRRRVLESLYMPVAGHRAFARELTRPQRSELLTPRANDTIYVAFAIVECAYAPLGRAMKEDQRKVVVDAIQRFSRNHFTAEQREGLEMQIRFWEHAVNKELADAEELLGASLSSVNQYVAVPAARAAVTWDKLSVGDRIAVIRRIRDSPNKMVRRVSAREVVLRFLVECLGRRSQVKAEARSLLVEIAGDPDDIIRVTMLDIIEYGLKESESVREEVCSILESLDVDGALAARIARARGAA